MSLLDDIIVAADEIQYLRAENVRLTSERDRYKNMLEPFLEQAAKGPLIFKPAEVSQ